MSYRITLALAFVVVVCAAPALAAVATHTETLSASATLGGARVNINTASVKELMTLEGVGRRVAEKIVEYRETRGPFKKPEDLRKVEGVGGGLWEKNKDRVVIK